MPFESVFSNVVNVAYLGSEQWNFLQFSGSVRCAFSQAIFIRISWVIVVYRGHHSYVVGQPLSKDQTFFLEQLANANRFIFFF